MDSQSLARLRPQMVALVRAFEVGDASQFIAALQALSADSEAMTSSCELETAPSLAPQLQQLTVDARAALERFSNEARLQALAEHDNADADRPPDRVVRLPDLAANRTLDMPERSGPLVDHATRESAALSVLWRELSERDQNLFDSQETVDRIQQFLDRTRREVDALHRNLAEVLTANGYQDIARKIVRSVARFATDLETVQRQLTRLGGLAISRVGDRETPSSRDDTNARLPGVAASSQ